MRTLIFGATGQTGSYLAEHLLPKNHEVIGVARRTSTPNTERLVNVLDYPKFKLVPGDITDFGSVLSLIGGCNPDWIINLAAQSHVGTSFGQACSSMDITAKGCVNILEAARQAAPAARIYQASSSEMFGKCISFCYDVQGDGARYDGVLPPEGDSRWRNRFGFENMTPLNNEDGVYQDEETPFLPQSPYAIAKVAAHNFCLLYRKAYNMDIRTAIMFNHESERRGEEFVTRKITKWIGEYLAWKAKTIHSNNVEHDSGLTFEEGSEHITPGKISTMRSNPKKKPYGSYESWIFGPKFPMLRLGNLDVSRDWGHALDYVKAMTLIMEAELASDWVVATGETHKIKEFLELAFKIAGIECWENFVVIDDKLKRPAEVPFLKGDSSRIREELRWKPEISFPKLVKQMVDHDIAKYQSSPQNRPIRD